MVRSPLKPVIIAGPTASGKSSLALELAKRHNGEIICADSRQFYQGMTIGTAAPTNDDVKNIAHHGYGAVDLASKKVDAGFFVRFALEKIAAIQARGVRPMLVGGTGLYLRALYYGLADVPPSDQTIAQDIARRCEEFGLAHLYGELQKIDPVTAQAIKPQDGYRIMRAMEIFHITKTPPSQLRTSFSEDKPQLRAYWIYKKPDKNALIKKIEARVDTMFADGLIEEAKHLRSRLPTDHWALDVMGYREALQVVDNKLSLQEAKVRTFIRHRQYAKRQYTWFNKEPFYRTIS